MARVIGQHDDTYVVFRHPLHQCLVAVSSSGVSIRLGGSDPLVGVDSQAVSELLLLGVLGSVHVLE